MNIGVYVHIPFCRTKCDYCGFYSVPVAHLQEKERAGLFVRYTERLIAEISQRKNDFTDFEIDTVYFGGGTPSLLAPESVKNILESLEQHIGFSDRPLETTIECNPEDFTINGIGKLVEAGINRVVLGVQTLDPSNRRFIGRSSANMRPGLIEEFVRIPGIDHCLDLIVGIPSERDYLHGELELVASFGIDHISAYLLSVEEGTPLAQRFRANERFEEMQREAFLLTRKVLSEKGFIHYEVSNYCLPGKFSRHNMKYWKFQSYAGFGAGSHSFYGFKRFINRYSLDEYMISNKTDLEHDIRGGRSVIAEYLFTGMRLFEGVSAADFKKTLGIDFPSDIIRRLDALHKKGYVRIYDEKDFRAGFTLEGMLIMDTLLGEILEGYI